MPSHNLASKLDRALAAYLVSESVADADQIYTAKRGAQKALPNVIVSTTQLDIPEGDFYSGNRIATVVAAVRYDPAADETEATRLEADALFGRLVDAFEKQNGGDSALLCDAINAAAWAKAASEPDDHADLAEFSCIGLVPLGEGHGYDETGVWHDHVRLRVWCCPSNVA
jgi:mRNA-degrading endonuclease toxin of MazEF toxin-antitoxin module